MIPERTTIDADLQPAAAAGFRVALFLNVKRTDGLRQTQGGGIGTSDVKELSLATAPPPEGKAGAVSQSYEVTQRRRPAPRCFAPSSAGRR